MLVLRFAEAWIVEFYAAGTVAAYNGYASGGTKEDAYYVIPSHIIKNLISYFNRIIDCHARQTRYVELAGIYAPYLMIVIENVKQWYREELCVTIKKQNER